ncbi:hypothetical protein [Halobacterium sp. CBA1126]|uniref:hypothetical protein n=1 Tax=Halobacterium TaxID=2239 RepID=UPI0012FAE6B4|nr:hypothetical protein [Halobacterium sp. CBA1126]MUV60871.1 hypothetical protein [Halobacterium sp. CBA1126]
MSDTERVWLVFREYTDKGLLNLVYATPEGDRVLRKQRSMNAGDPTAAVDADVADLEPVEDPEDRERYGQEASRMRDSHDPDDRV